MYGNPNHLQLKRTKTPEAHFHKALKFQNHNFVTFHSITYNLPFLFYSYSKHVRKEKVRIISKITFWGLNRKYLYVLHFIFKEYKKILSLPQNKDDKV